MWTVEIINSDEIRVKDTWSLEILSKIESSKRFQLALKRKVVIKQENILQRAAVLTFLYKTSPRKTLLQHCSREHAVHTRNTIRTIRYRVVYNMKHYGRDIVLHAIRNTVQKTRHRVVYKKKHSTEETSCYTRQGTVRRMRHPVVYNKKHSTEETSCYTQQETQCGQRDVVLCARNTVRKRHCVKRNKKHSAGKETSCCTQQET